jgi:hypothetical protein
MKMKTSLILVCAAAIHANAQISSTVQTGSNAAQTKNGEVSNFSQIYSTPELSDVASVTALQQPQNGKNVMSVNSNAFCIGACNGAEWASADGNIWETMYLLGPSTLNNIVLTTTLTSSDIYNQTFFPFVCASNSDYLVDMCQYLTAPLPQFQFVVGNQVTLQVHADAGVYSGGFNIYTPYAYSTASIDNIAVVDQYGHPMSNVKYCTASGYPLPVQNGVFELCILRNWMLAGPFEELVGGAGNLYVNPTQQQLYVPQKGSAPKIQVFNSNSLAPIGDIYNVDAAGVTVSAKFAHGFSSGNPVLMWDTVSLRTLSTIPLGAGVTPGAIVLDPVNDLVYLFHQEAPLATILRASDGSTAGEVTLTGIAKEAVTDGKGKVYAGVPTTDGFDVEILGYLPNGVLGVANNWFLAGQTCSGIAMDGANAILFATCKTPAAPPSPNGAPALPQAPYQLTAFQAGHQILNSAIGVLASSAGAVFSSATGEVFSLQTDGTMTIVKEVNPTTFQEEKFLTATTSTPKSLALDPNTPKVFFTSQGVSSDNVPETFLYELRPR